MCVFSFPFQNCFLFYLVFSNFIILFLRNKRAKMGPLINSVMSVTIVPSRLRVVGEKTRWWRR